MTDWGEILKHIGQVIQELDQLFKLLTMLIGSHGDGSASETEVPIVTWGAGLSYAKKRPISLPVNINQADVTPLMATLIGVPIPVHSTVCIKFSKLKNNDQF